MDKLLIKIYKFYQSLKIDCIKHMYALNINLKDVNESTFNVCDYKTSINFFIKNLLNQYHISISSVLLVFHKLMYQVVYLDLLLT